MKKYEVKGGGTIEAASDFDLVERLRETSFTPSESQQQFMEDMARRCELQTGAKIQTTDPETFIQDLVSEGFLTPIAPLGT